MHGNPHALPSKQLKQFQQQYKNVNLDGTRWKYRQPYSPAPVTRSSDAQIVAVAGQSFVRENINYIRNTPVYQSNITPFYSTSKDLNRQLLTVPQPIVNWRGEQLTNTLNNLPKLHLREFRLPEG